METIMLSDFTMLPNEILLSDGMTEVHGIFDNQDYIVCTDTADDNKGFYAVHIDSLPDCDRLTIWEHKAIYACRL